MSDLRHLLDHAIPRAPSEAPSLPTPTEYALLGRRAIRRRRVRRGAGAGLVAAAAVAVMSPFWAALVNSDWSLSPGTAVPVPETSADQSTPQAQDGGTYIDPDALTSPGSADALVVRPGVTVRNRVDLPAQNSRPQTVAVVTREGDHVVWTAHLIAPFDQEVARSETIVRSVRTTPEHVREASFTQWVDEVRVAGWSDRTQYVAFVDDNLWPIHGASIITKLVPEATELPAGVTGGAALVEVDGVRLCAGAGVDDGEPFHFTYPSSTHPFPTCVQVLQEHRSGD